MTIKKIAELACVSSATVSKVLNEKDQRISEATRRRVLAIAEQENYVPNAVAKSLKVKRTKTIGIIIPDVTNVYFSELARGVEDASEMLGYSLILCNSDNREEKEEKYLRILQEKMVDGIILTAAEGTLSRRCKGRQIPLVLLDRDIDTSEKTGRIVVDNEAGIYKATEHLVDKGCRHIAFISSGKESSIARERLAGYRRALADNRLPLEPSRVYLDSFNIKTGYEGTMALLDEGGLDGICCGNDLIAIGAVKALKERQLQVPDQVKVIGFDDITMSRFVDPPLTTIRQPVYQMGEEAVSMLVAIIEGKEGQTVKIFNTELVERSTT